MAKESPTRRVGSDVGFTLIELMIVMAIIGVLASLCVAFLMGARASANEASAIGSLRTLNSAQNAYNSTCGGGHYAPTFALLVSGNFASPDINASPKSGFVFVLAPGAAGIPSANDCQGQPTQTRYYATATPIGVGFSIGHRSFATSEAGTIWERPGTTAPVEPFGSDGATPLN
jgi:type IV pilus assembly protein PilA